MREVGFEDVDFPLILIRIAYPEFGLAGVAAFDAIFSESGDAGQFEPALDVDQGGGGGDSQAGVIKWAGGAGGVGLLEREDQRQIGGLEFGVIGFALHRRCTKKQLEETHRTLEIPDIEREVKHRRGSRIGFRHTITSFYEVPIDSQFDLWATLFASEGDSKRR